MRTSLELEPGERILAAAQDDAGQWLVATDSALLVGRRRVAWIVVARAGWDDDAETLSVDTMRSAHEPPELLRWVLREPGLLPETVRERVDASIVASRRVRVNQTGGLRVVARSAARSDELVWQILLDTALEATDVQIQAASEKALDELRRDLGG